jgi:hypothetical protein
VTHAISKLPKDRLPSWADALIILFAPVIVIGTALGLALVLC